MERNWAITIGINRYDNLQALNYAKRDAEAVRDFFRNELNFEQVYHFSDDSPRIATDYGPPIKSRPTYATLRRFLRVRFEQPFLQAGDNFWFFFAGHGLRHEERDYLMPLDADPGDVEGSAIPISYVTERLRRCGADNVVLFLDACRSEGRRAGLGVGTEVQKGVITFFSCSPAESSYEIDQLQEGAGAFTHALLEGLRIRGEGNCATVERLYNYLRYQVRELNLRYNKPLQTPYAIVEPATKYHLILLPRSATVRDADTLKLDAYKAETAGDMELAKQLWIRVLAVSHTDMDAISAIERIARSSRTSPQPPVSEEPPSVEPGPSRTVTPPLSPSAAPPSEPEQEVKPSTQLRQAGILSSKKARRSVLLGNIALGLFLIFSAAASIIVVAIPEVRCFFGLQSEFCPSLRVDYTRLRDLLAVGKWKEADQETTRTMLQAAGREKEGWLDYEGMDKFSCEDLRIINQLWLDFSQGKFGFSVQKDIYLNLGGTIEYNREVWLRFSTQVGWRQGGRWLNYSDLTFNLNAPKGQLPLGLTGDWLGDKRGGWVWEDYGGYSLWNVWRRTKNCDQYFPPSIPGTVSYHQAIDFQG